MAKKEGDKAIAFSNHGGIYDWIKKKDACDSAGIKYIHGVELYMVDRLYDNDRGYHIGLYSKNWEGVKELNSLISISTSKGKNKDNSDRHFYYNPRLSLEEIMNTSKNIIITTACLQSILWHFTEKYNRIKNLKATELKNNEKQKLDELKIKSMTEEMLDKYKNAKTNEKNKILEGYEYSLDNLANYYKDVRDKFIKWLSENSDRCFLEIQYHNSYDQINYNYLLWQLSEKYNIPLIAGTDTHSSNNYKAECRKILQKSKDSFYGDEDEFDLTWKTYNELVQKFKEQNNSLNKKSLPEDVYLKAIENTNRFAEMVEDFKLDKSFKYPNQYGSNAKEKWWSTIIKKLDDKINKCEIDKDAREEYIKQVKIEFDDMTDLGMESFMLFMSELKDFCIKNNIPTGDRGSVNGSAIAFITDITDVDPFVWGTVFSRFCNKDRVSLGDIDIDFCPEDREKVYKFIIDFFGRQNTAYILTLGTEQDRGTIDVLAKGLEYKDLDFVAKIKDAFDNLHKSYKKIVQQEVNIEELEGEEEDAKNINFDHHKIYINRIRNENAKTKLKSIKDEWENLKKQNKELFYYFDGVKGTITSKGNHAAGIIGSPINLVENMGVHYKDGDESFPVSSCTMKAVDGCNYVKFDILGLKTLGIIKDVYKYIGKEWERAYRINWEDRKVWDNMIQHPTGVFQFEGDFSFGLLKQFRPKKINDMSLVNACIRPSGKSYRDGLIARKFYKNPSILIDNLLKDNNGYLVYQEDTIKFLQEICGLTGAEADTVRRAIGKKDEKLLKSYLPRILDGYCKKSNKPRSESEKEAQHFIQIIQDSSEYQFGKNHSDGYSMNGYKCVRFRTYYPLEFTTAYLNRATNDNDILMGTNLAKSLGIKIKPIKFRYSQDLYAFDRDTNSIYKGIESIKYMNSEIAIEMYKLRDNKYKNFIDLLKDLKQKTSLDSRQLSILIKLDFFSEFGKSQYLLDIVDIFNKYSSSKIINKSTLSEEDFLIVKKYARETKSQFRDLDLDQIVKDLCRNIDNIDIPIYEKIKYQKDYLGYINYRDQNLDKRYCVVSNLNTRYSPKFNAYCLNTGKTMELKCHKLPKNKKRYKGVNTYYEDVPFKDGDILYLNKSKRKQKSRYDNSTNEYIPIEGEYEWWVKDYTVVTDRL